MKTKLRPFGSLSEFQVEHSLAHELPYWDFLEDTVVLAEGTLAIGYQLRGIAIETLDTDRINQITNDLRSSLNSLPDGCEASFVANVNSDFEGTLAAHEKLSGKDGLVSWVSAARLSALREASAGSQLIKPHLYLFLYKRFERNDSRMLNLVRSFFAAPKSFVEIKRAEHEKSHKELSQLGMAVSGTLQSLGIETNPMNGKEIWSLLYSQINPGRSQIVEAPILNLGHRCQEFSVEELSKVPALALPSPREQLVFSDLIQSYDSFFLDGHYHRIITVKTLPEFTHSALIARLQQLPFHHMLHVHVRVPEQSKELSSLQAKRRMAHSMSMSQGGRATDLESEAKLHSTEDLLREIINSGQKIFYFQVTILLKDTSRDELESKTRATLVRLRELNGCEGITETVAGFKVWKTLLPLGTTTMVRPKRVKTDNLADFLPIYEPYDGLNHLGSNPICLFQNRSMGLVQYDPFDPRLPNYNVLVTGSSGAGKSFLNNLVLLQYVTQDPLVFIIDIGGSYRKLCEFLSGQYIEISPAREGEQTKSINPMELPEGKKLPPPEKIKFLLALLENLLTDEDGDKLPKLDRSLLEEAILEVYRLGGDAGKPPRLGDLAQYLSESKEPGHKDFARMLYPWTGERPYGRLLDGPRSLDLTSHFVVFDLKGLAAYPDLQAAMVLIITDLILGRVENTKGRRKQILMDECWELLKSRGSQRFMEHCVRTLRKTGSGITFITQGLEEIVASPIGSAILSNTATKFVLQQRGDLKPTREIMKLNDQEMMLISSLRQSKGEYSEAFLICDDRKTVIQVHPTPIEYWLATSDAEDNHILEKARIEAPKKTLAEHVHDLSLKYPHGARGVGK